MDAVNRSILAACLWAVIVIIALVGFMDDPKETVCIAAQSISFGEQPIIYATECFEVTP